jgi:chromosome partitioning protein
VRNVVASLELGLNFPYVKEFIAAIVSVGGFAYTCYRFGKRAGNNADRSVIKSLEHEGEMLRQSRDELGARLLDLERTVKDPKDFWLRSPSTVDLVQHQEAMASSVPVICVVNFKGGVGKTTISANLASHFAGLGKRVLLIDSDYQGSLSETVMSHAQVADYVGSSYMLIEGERDPETVRGKAERLVSIDSRMWIYPAFYDYSRAEVKMMFRWLVGRDTDIRYNLGRYLRSAPFSPENAESGFDLVIIDAPPRLLTGVVNALVASTHVLVPTILDGQSQRATVNTVMAIQQFRQKLNPALKFLGIVPSMVSAATGYNDREREASNDLERALGESGEFVPVLKSCPIWRREELAKAGGSEIVYSRSSNNASTREVREMFAKLGEHIEQNVRWRKSRSLEDIFAVPGLSKAKVAQ